MAAELRRRRVGELNDETIELLSNPKIGAERVNRFLSGHPELKSTTGRSVDAARVKDASPESGDIAWFEYGFRGNFAGKLFYGTGTGIGLDEVSRAALAEEETVGPVQCECGQCCRDE
jgi:hypothetical protein